MANRKENQIAAWLDEIESDEFDDDLSCSEDEEDFIGEEWYNTESEQEQDVCNQVSDYDNEPPQRDRRGEIYLGVDNTLWTKNAPANSGRIRRHNIVLVPPVLKESLDKKPEDCMLLFLGDVIISLIIKYTNIKIESIKTKYARERDATSTDEIEIKRFLGILLMAGVLKVSRSSTSQIFDKEKHTGIGSIYLTMSQQRFKFLLRVTRFDDITVRQ